MNIQKVCNNVAQDIDTREFFCMRCGHAGYSTKEQAMGHQAQCPVRKKGFKVGGYLASQPASLHGVNELPSKPPISETLPSPDMVIPQSDIQRQLALVTMELAEIKKTQAKFFENEIPHMQAVQQLGSLGVPTVWIVVGAIALVMLMFREDKPCNCESESEETKKKKPPKSPSSIVSNIVTRSASKIVDKTIDKFFGK
jgi:hypothetical protein